MVLLSASSFLSVIGPVSGVCLVVRPVMFGFCFFFFVDGLGWLMYRIGSKIMQALLGALWLKGPASCLSYWPLCAVPLSWLQLRLLLRWCSFFLPFGVNEHTFSKILAFLVVLLMLSRCTIVWGILFHHVSFLPDLWCVT